MKAKTPPRRRPIAEYTQQSTRRKCRVLFRSTISKRNDTQFKLGAYVEEICYIIRTQITQSLRAYNRHCGFKTDTHSIKQWPMQNRMVINLQKTKNILGDLIQTYTVILVGLLSFQKLKCCQLPCAVRFCSYTVRHTQYDRPS